MSEEEKENGIKISVPIITNQEIETIINNETLYDKIAKHVYYEREMIILQEYIKKQQKEIEKLKYLENKTYQNYAILKQKIKDKIKFINNLEENLYYKENVIFILQELLKEE